MEARAIGRYLRVTPRKARLVLDAVRGKSANEALGILKFTPNEAAKYIRRLLESAIANAENNYAMDREALRLVRAYADNGPILKRIHPRAMGRAFRILKRMSHITVIVAEDESLRKAVAKPKTKRLGRRTTATPPPHGQAASSQSAQEQTEKRKKAPAATIEPKAARKAKAVKPEAAKPEEKVLEEPIVEVEAVEQVAEAPEASKPEEQVVEEPSAQESAQAQTPPVDTQAPDPASSESAAQTEKTEE